MTKAEIASAVNEWFNIENYSVLQNLTVEQLFQEIENRIVAQEKNVARKLLYYGRKKLIAHNTSD